MRPGSPGERLLRGLETFLVRRAAAVITLLPGMSDYLHGRRLNPRRLAYVPNGVDLAAFDAPPSDGTSTPELEFSRSKRSTDSSGDGRFVLGYVGAFGRVNQIEVIIRAAAIAERRVPGRVGVVLVGDGPDRPHLERLASGEPGVALCPAIPRKSVPHVLRALDGTVLHATPRPSTGSASASTNSSSTWLHGGRLSSRATSYDPILLSGAGFSVPPDDPDEMATAFLSWPTALPRRWRRWAPADVRTLLASTTSSGSPMDWLTSSRTRRPPEQASRQGVEPPAASSPASSRFPRWPCGSERRCGSPRRTMRNLPEPG